MRRLTIEVDSDIADWIERRRGAMAPGEFAARAIAEYRTADEHATAARMAHMQADVSGRLDELQERIRRLDRSLKERRPHLAVGAPR